MIGLVASPTPVHDGAHECRATQWLGYSSHWSVDSDLHLNLFRIKMFGVGFAARGTLS